MHSYRDGLVPVLDVVCDLSLIGVLLQRVRDTILADLVWHTARAAVGHVCVHLPRMVGQFLHDMRLRVVFARATIINCVIGLISTYLRMHPHWQMVLE